MPTSRLTPQDIEAANSAAQELGYWSVTLINAAHGRIEPPASLLAPEAQAEFFSQTCKQLLANVDRHVKTIDNACYPAESMHKETARLALRVRQLVNTAAAVIALKGGDPGQLRWGDVAGKLRVNLRESMDWLEVRDRLAEEVAARTKQPSASKRTRRRQSPRTPKPLTAIQTEAIQLFGECKGNYAEVGRRMGIAPKTARQHVTEGQKKLGAMSIKHATTSIRNDRRGQSTIADGDDRRR